MVEAFCLASGPSLTLEDAEKVKAWRGEGRMVIVANTTFRAAPWADAMFAMDRMWWTKYHPEWQQFKGKRYSTQKLPEEWGIEQLRKFEPFGNSGAGCISLAIHLGAKKVYMLGYDCKKGPKSHWHGEHPRGLGNAGSITRWPMHFDRLKGAFPKVQIINCTRDTVLKTFPQMRLEDALRIVPGTPETAGEALEQAA